MKILMLVGAFFLITLAGIFLLVRLDILDADIWSYYPIILALGIAFIFLFTFIKNNKRRSK